jgi:hypothetical protein
MTAIANGLNLSGLFFELNTTASSSGDALDAPDIAPLSYFPPESGFIAATEYLFPISQTATSTTATKPTPEQAALLLRLQDYKSLHPNLGSQDLFDLVKSLEAATQMLDAAVQRIPNLAEGKNKITSLQFLDYVRDLENIWKFGLGEVACRISTPEDPRARDMVYVEPFPGTGKGVREDFEEVEGDRYFSANVDWHKVTEELLALLSVRSFEKDLDPSLSLARISTLPGKLFFGVNGEPCAFRDIQKHVRFSRTHSPMPVQAHEELVAEMRSCYRAMIHEDLDPLYSRHPEESRQELRITADWRKLYDRAKNEGRLGTVAAEREIASAHLLGEITGEDYLRFGLAEIYLMELGLADWTVAEEAVERDSAAAANRSRSGRRSFSDCIRRLSERGSEEQHSYLEQALGKHAKWLERFLR